jgi:hypothetical protein
MRGTNKQNGEQKWEKKAQDIRSDDQLETIKDVGWKGTSEWQSIRNKEDTRERDMKREKEKTKESIYLYLYKGGGTVELPWKPAMHESLLGLFYSEDTRRAKLVTWAKRSYMSKVKWI